MPLFRLGLAACMCAAAATSALAQMDNSTKCYVRGSFRAVIIRNGQSSQRQCQALAVKCLGSPNVVASYSPTPYIIHQNFSVCTLLE